MKQSYCRLAVRLMHMQQGLRRCSLVLGPPAHGAFWCHYTAHNHHQGPMPMPTRKLCLKCVLGGACAAWAGIRSVVGVTNNSGILPGGMVQCLVCGIIAAVCLVRAAGSRGVQAGTPCHPLVLCQCVCKFATQVCVCRCARALSPGQ